MVTRIIRSAGVRLALGYAVVFGASAALLILVLWIAGINILTRQVDAAIDADEQGLAEQWRAGGPGAFLRTIQSRIASNIDRDSIYLVLDPEGRVIASNIDSVPDQFSHTGEVYEVTVRRNGQKNLARFHRYGLPADYMLLVGRDISSRVALRTLLAEVLAWSMVLIGLLSIAGAMLLRLLFRRMVSQVSQTADAISSGDLTRRVAISGRGDEFDRMAETINDMLDRVSRLMDGVREVSNAIAHDLRTPITRARARLEDAVTHAGTADQLRCAIDRAVSDLDGITNVFHALLRISEIEAGARRSAFVALDLRPLLDDLHDLYAAVAEERGLTLTLVVPNELWARGDRELIQQALTNLLDNAIKFSPPGAVVELEARKGADGVTLSVRDHGPGIPDSEVERAVERFYRGETARNTPGFGLGLTLVRAVAQLHGGSLALREAQPGLRAVLLIPNPVESRPRRSALPAEGDDKDVAMSGTGRIERADRSDTVEDPMIVHER